jgi:hypothetical protein
MSGWLRRNAIIASVAVAVPLLLVFGELAPAAAQQAQPSAAKSGAAPPIWFSTEDEYIRAASGRFPPNDYTRLFDENSAAEWPATLSHLSGFFLGANVVAPSKGDQELSRILSFLKLHRVSVTLNAGMVEPDPATGCGGGEGYSYNLNTPHPASTSKRYITLAANHIKRLGGTVVYLSMDEPLYRGHLLAKLGRPVNRPDAPMRIGCQYPIDVLAQKILPNIQLIKAEFPNVLIGETINLNREFVTHLSNREYEREVEKWALAYKAATGEPMAFSLVDIGEDQSQWATELPKLAAFYRSLGTSFGILYTAPGNIPDNDTWVRAVEDQFRFVEGSLGIHPDFVCFASWVKYPLEVLPEDRPGTFANLIRDYLRFHGVRNEGR